MQLKGMLVLSQIGFDWEEHNYHLGRRWIEQPPPPPPPASLYPTAGVSKVPETVAVLTAGKSDRRTRLLGKVLVERENGQSGNLERDA